MEVRTRLNEVNLREVRIVPQGTGYTVEIVYEKEIMDFTAEKPRRIMGIDIGVRDIVTIGDNISSEGIAVRGGILKSINQFFNKENSRLKSISDRQIGNRQSTQKEKHLFMKRNRMLKDIMHKLSMAIVQYAETRNIDTIVIGHNDGWKQEVNMGKWNNQNFVQLPFNIPFSMLHCWLVKISINSPFFSLYLGGFGIPKNLSGCFFHDFMDSKNELHACFIFFIVHCAA